MDQFTFMIWLISGEMCSGVLKLSPACDLILTSNKKLFCAETFKYPLQK